jgi:hypothetical protein
MNKLKSSAGTTVLLLMSANFFTACGGGDSSPAGGQGGGSGAGGQSSTGGAAAGGAAGGSGSLVAAMSLNFLGGGVNCSIPAGYDDFPSVSGGHPVTAAGATVTTPDNVTSPRGLVRVQCSIGGSVLQATITLGGGAVSIGFAASRSGTVSGVLAYTGLNSSVNYNGTSAAPCTVAAISTTATGGLYSVSCPTLTGSDGSSCVLGESYVYFSGCTTQ